MARIRIVRVVKCLRNGWLDRISKKVSALCIWKAAMHEQLIMRDA